MEKHVDTQHDIIMQKYEEEVNNCKKSSFEEQPCNTIEQYFKTFWCSESYFKNSLKKEVLHDLSLFVAKNNFAIIIVERIIFQQLILGQIPCVVFT